ncbi:ribosome assembly factor SBDS [Candidatus Bathyarchaeota archaeon]|nr:MAG: ribosome assembly factor SBDS [Candidatus Bathyarchaeota archaeon]TMI49757.1 MAG: ribosome assembly factor SBDS [Candidatus Bathyarchaeota archaeon]TMI56225.1 MAG: ribosome assembly factor SBDS [Candidatus Bathyarchaeota archaeon]
MSDKYTTARLAKGQDHFEILVKPQEALDYKLGKQVPISQVLLIEEVYSDSSKGTRASEEKLQKYFGTTDPARVAEEVMKSGELQLTTEQRRQLVEDKRRQIISIISRNAIDPRTGTPHPPLRIEQAMGQIRLSIDPYKSAEEQSKMVIEELRPILPLKIEQMRIAVKVFPEHAARAYNAFKSFGNVSREEWQSDGSLVAVVEMPAGMYGSFIEKVGKLTQGTIQSKVLT